MRLFLKGRKATEGTISTWIDGTRVKKVGKKWVVIGREGVKKESASKMKEIAKQHFDEALKMFTEATGKMSWAGIGIVEHLEDKYKIYDFEGLKSHIKKNPGGEASKIYRSTKAYIDTLSISTGLKKIAQGRFAQVLIKLRDAYAQPKLKLMVKQESGKVPYKYKEAEPVFSATAIRYARSKLGTWTDMKKVPTSAQVRAMIKNKSGKLVSGKIDPKKKWDVYQKLDDVVVPFKSSEKGVTVRMRQFRSGAERTRQVATVELTIPYAYARQFLTSQIKSVRTRNNLIGQMERSAGYKKTIGKKVA